MVIGGLASLVVFVRDAADNVKKQAAYGRLRRNLGRCILLGLEVLIVADIVRTIVVDPTLETVTVLGIIVLIRILLSFSLEVGARRNVAMGPLESERERAERAATSYAAVRRWQTRDWPPVITPRG
jgi:uncharacterized membrane protein